MSSISFTDAIGAVTLSNLRPAPADGFRNWNPDADPVGPSAVGLGTGKIHKFTLREDYLVSFELPNVPASELDKLLRVQTHLLDGYLVALDNDDYMHETFALCRLAENGKAEIAFTDKVRLLYTLRVLLKAVDPADVVGEDGLGDPGDDSGTLPPPFATFSWTYTDEQKLLFDSGGSRYLPGATLAWTFDDGGSDTGTTSEHQYALDDEFALAGSIGTNGWRFTVGQYRSVTLTITDAGGTATVTSSAIPTREIPLGGKGGQLTVVHFNAEPASGWRADPSVPDGKPFEFVLDDPGWRQNFSNPLELWFAAHAPQLGFGSPAGSFTDPAQEPGACVQDWTCTVTIVDFGNTTTASIVVTVSPP